MHPAPTAPYKTLYNRWKRWGEAGVFTRMMEGLAAVGAEPKTVQIQGVYGDEVAADIERNCTVRLVLRPTGLAEAKKISDQLGNYTFRARSRSMGTWGGGGGSTSDSDQRRPLMLPQEVELLPETDLIVFRRGMYATYGKKVRYYAEKKLAERTRIRAPEMPQIWPDPAIAANSLRVIEAAKAEPPSGSRGAPLHLGETDTATAERRHQSLLNRVAIEAALAAPPKQRVENLFNALVTIKND